MLWNKYVTWIRYFTHGHSGASVFSKASGIDDLSGIFLKDGAKLLTMPITQLCNLSISSGTFPDACKITKLKPLFKKSARTDPKNYLPVSLLRLIS